MSLANDANLLLIPSGYKAGKVYSQFPASGDGDFTFSRTGEATRINQAGLIETVASDVPRLDYPSGKCPDLLLEPQRTNLITYSEDFSQSYWTKTNTNTSNSVISPDSGLNGTKYTLDVTNSRSQISRSIFSVGTLYSISVFVKYDSVKYFYISNAGSAAYRTVFDIENGIIVSNGASVSSSKIENYGNGWYRCSSVFTAGYTVLYLNFSPNTNNSVFTNTTDFSYIYGAQVEQGSYSTSYIPTSGSVTTKNQDYCIGAGDAALFNDSEGVLYAELNLFELTSSVNRYISIDDGNNASYNNIIAFQYRSNGSVRCYFGGLATSNLLFLGDGNFDFTENHKIAIRYKSGEMAVYLNGISQSLYGNFVYTSLLGLSRLSFGMNNTSFIFQGKCKDLRYYNTALTDTQLTELTTL